MVKSLVFFESYNKCFTIEICFRTGQILFNLACTFAVHHGKSFVPSFFEGFYWSPTDEVDNLESGKRNYCFGKSLEKVLNFGSKILYEPCLS